MSTCRRGIGHAPQVVFVLLAWTRCCCRCRCLAVAFTIGMASRCLRCLAALSSLSRRAFAMGKASPSSSSCWCRHGLAMPVPSCIVHCACLVRLVVVVFVILAVVVAPSMPLLGRPSDHGGGCIVDTGCGCRLCHGICHGWLVNIVLAWMRCHCHRLCHTRVDVCCCRLAVALAMHVSSLLSSYQCGWWVVQVVVVMAALLVGHHK